jgi:small subunit ribosomal protein S6
MPELEDPSHFVTNNVQVRAGNVAEIKEIARATGSLVLSSHGVVRGLSNWGSFLLTKPVRRNQAKHILGHHFVMRFDCSPSTQEAVRTMLGLDPRMIKFGIVKLGKGTLESGADVGSKVKWT